MKYFVVPSFLVLLAAGPAPVPPSPGASADQAPMLAAMRAQMDTVNACYDEVLKRYPGQGGTFEVELSIEADGSVSKAEPTKGPFKDAAFFKCLTSTIQKWKLPPEGYATSMTVPFTFTPPQFTPAPSVAAPPAPAKAAPAKP